MPDKGRCNTVPRVKLGFERQQAKNVVGSAANLVNPALAPRPNRWADVMHGWNAAVLELPLKAEIEIRRVNTDEYIRWIFRPAANQLTAQTQQSGDMPQGFDQAHYRQGIRFFERMATRLLHRDSGHTFELDARYTLAQCVDQSGTQQIA